ncbi:hypothetical protein N7454_003121 [Penicillium verhagenii]|nr:hypothetical protein N7454_003121 [Penicillium verhagenii]
MGSDTPPSRRVGGSKSRYGCQTCKIRRVKCGEEKPLCLRCVKTGRKCEYGATDPSSSTFPTLYTGSPSYSLAESPNKDCGERRAFEYYVQNVSKGLAAGMNLDFWTKVAPQICRSEPAVWDAIISISVLYEHPDQCLDFPLLRFNQGKNYSLNHTQRDALTWYSRAISNVHSQIVRGKADPYIALISCVLFICVEAIQGRAVEALQLYEQGVNLILTLRHQVAAGALSLPRSLFLENTIIPLFVRLGAISLTISVVQVSEIFNLTDQNLNTAFISLDAARTAISVIFAEVTLLEREAMPIRRAPIGEFVVGPEMLAKQRMLKSKLDQWLLAYTNLCKTGVRAEPVMLTFHAAASIYISTCLTQQQLIYDDYIEDFAIIVENAGLAFATSGGSAPFTFEMGLGLPLFLTAIKCRDSSLRRKALELLRQAPPVQAFFPCTPQALLAEKCMELEEHYGHLMASMHESTDTGEYSTIIPEEARICYHDVFRPRDTGSPGGAGGRHWWG